MTPWTVARQVPLSMGFPRQVYWSRLPFPSPGVLPSAGIQTSIFCTGRRVLYHFPGGSDSKSFCLQLRRPGFDPWVGKIPWRRKWQPTSVLLPWKSHGRRSLVGYSPWGCKESDMTKQLNFHFFRLSPILIFPTQGSNPGLLSCKQMLLPSEPPGIKEFSHHVMYTQYLCSDTNLLFLGDVCGWWF